MKVRMTHLINERGEKLVVEARDFNTSQQEGDGKYDGWYIDVDWYLANGYKTLEETRRIIEGQMANVCIVDTTGKLDGYVTLEEFMERTSYLDEKNMNDDDFDGMMEETIAEIAEINMEDKKKAVDNIQRYGKVHFVEKIDGEHKIGFIKEYDGIIQVSYRRDNMGEYLELSYTIEWVDNAEKSRSYLKNWFVNGRYEIEGDSIRLYTIFPLLDNAFLQKQLKHALLEIWDMKTVATSSSR